MKAQMVKWGNSLAVRIPKPIIEEAHLKEGDFLEIEASDGQIELRRATKIPTLAQLVSQITSVDRSAPVRASAWRVRGRPGGQSRRIRYPPLRVRRLSPFNSFLSEFWIRRNLGVHIIRGTEPAGSW